ncbi:MAG: hypothetical protein HY360_10715 [Verrucomicrobia bacterium]|nr:hypothetical protein [Verrucomicrobiota bacterium]
MEHLDRLKRRGTISFDGIILGYFVINTGGDFLAFDRERWPNGSGRYLRKVKQSRLKLGMGLAASSPIIWSIGRNPVVASSASATGSCGQFCMAAEPYRTLVQSGMRDYARMFGMQWFGIDQFFPCCHNPHHGHRIGKYAGTANFNAAIELLELLDRENPDLFIQLYWGFRSPWWLLWADTIFEPSGIYIEARNPTKPTLFFRDSVTLGLDRAHEFAKTVPHIGKDSLGVWLTKNLWNSDVGAERWQAALVMDLFRGSLLAQLWGHPSLLTTAEWNEAATLIGLLKAHPECFANSRRIIGNPWRDPVYGYCGADGERAFIALNNCSWKEARVNLDLDDFCSGGHPPPPRLRGTSRSPLQQRWNLYRWWPRPARLCGTGQNPEHGRKVRFEMRPFDIVLLEVVPNGRPPAIGRRFTDESLPRRFDEPASAIALQIRRREARGPRAQSSPTEKRTLITSDGGYDLPAPKQAGLSQRAKEQKPILQTLTLTGALPPMRHAGVFALVVEMRTGEFAARLGANALTHLSIAGAIDGRKAELEPNVGRAEASWQVYRCAVSPSRVPRPFQFTVMSTLPSSQTQLFPAAHLLSGIRI